jgi:hypothetical protein
MEHRTPKEAQATMDEAENNDDDDDDGEQIEDVTPTIAKREIATVDMLSGITLEEEPEPGRPPPCDSRWSIRKCFKNIPITHTSLNGVGRKTLRHELQGDSGANCTATDRKDLLWSIVHFDKPLQVKTFDGNNDDSGKTRTLEALGAGLMKMVDNNNHIMNHYSPLMPNSTGAVISLDKFMRAITRASPNFNKSAQSKAPAS